MQEATYSYDPVSGVLTGMSVALEPSGAPVSSATYSYYGGDVPYDPSGSPGQLEMVTTSAGAGAVDTTYYRYYTGSNTAGDLNAPGEIGRLEFVFNTASLQRMTAAGIDYLTEPDNVVAPYADQDFQYDADGQVLSDTAQGSGAVTYTNTPSGLPDGMNTWSNKQVETQTVNGATITTTTFTNYAGDALLTDTWNGLSGPARTRLLTTCTTTTATSSKARSPRP